MSAGDPLDAYRWLADELFEGRITEADLWAAAADLPPLDRDLLERLGQFAETFSATRPRFGWAITQVGHHASVSQNCSLFIRSLAAWYLGRACNHWAQPGRVREAISIARRGFSELNDSGWVAACDWQLNALSWTRPNFGEAVQALKDALTGLERAGFTEFLPDCRLALAYAQILIGDHHAALENARASEEMYVARADQLNQARCWLTQASSLRRQDQFDEALHRLEQALSVFERANAVTDQAKAHYQIALGELLKADDLAKAGAHFLKAADLFAGTDLDLWRAMCINNLGSVHLISGQLRLAEAHYQEARTHFARHEIYGLLADNLNDSGKLHILMGRPALSIEQFRECEAINERLGSRLPAAIAISNLGEAYGQLGRYQDALHHLERAARLLEPLEIYFRLATCEKYMAVIWSRLGQPEVAHEYLDKAAAHYEMAGQNALLSSVHNYRAATFFAQGKDAEAVESLQKALEIAAQHGIRPQIALAKRLLGEALLRAGRKEEALDYLEQAQSEFAGMGMAPEHAACMISIGTYYELISEPGKAASAFEAALQISENAFPEVDWRAHIELGNLAEAQGNLPLALAAYRRGTESLRQIRRNFLQPALAGTYLHGPARVFDHIVAVCAGSNSAPDTLYFIEEAKASTLLRNLGGAGLPGRDPASQELDDLRSEIDLLRSKLRTSLDEISALRSALRTRQIRDRLRDKVKQYDELQARLERRHLKGESPAVLPASLELGSFRERAAAFLRDDWIALDYYLSDDQLIIVIVTSSHCTVESRPISRRFAMALAACDQARRNASPPLESDLEILGTLLIPLFVAERITPDTHLLIAPHRGLHLVPWPALRHGALTRPLVGCCIPGVIPSLDSLALLWERADRAQSLDRRSGLLVGLSSFNGLHEELPLVRDEIAALSARLGPGGQVLAERGASWENLMKLKNGAGDQKAGAGLARYAWLHLATHFTPDRHSGRVGGIALSDGDIWLDQLRDLAPLPGLVSLSACNSNDSFLYEGDERVDLQTTCFIAGANSIVGTIWPVADQAVAELVLLFYEYYLTGLSPAEAAARAQRRFIASGREVRDWASLVCVGAP